MGKFQDLTDKRFGHWLVLKRAGNSGKKVMWSCRCDCGFEKEVAAIVLTTGKSKSCGCCTKEYVATKFPRRKTAHPLYQKYHHIKSRCYTQNANKYKNYGARGIKMADEWLSDFWAFAQYLENLPHYGDAGYSLDRIDVNGDYAPGNVRWATWKTQERNKSRHHYETAFGATKPLSEWAEQYAIKYSTLNSRLKRGWSLESALLTAVQNQRK